MKDFSSYSFEALIMDEDFIKWADDSDAEFENTSTQLCNGNDDQKAILLEARNFLQILQQYEPLEMGEKALLWRHIHNEISSREDGKVITMQQSHRPILKRLKPHFVAAAMILIVVVGFIMYREFASRSHKIETIYGEIKAVTLPDGSVVTMNAHSAINYQKDWRTINSREIWLDGEAYFSIKHTKTNQPFIVHTPEMDIEVLGTEFNVLKRNGKIKVSLNSGKVKIRLKQDGSLSDPIYMKPGDMVEYADETRAVKKKIVNPLNYSGWKDHKLIFEDTPVEEIVQTLKNIYNWQFTVTDASILEEKLTGEIETHDEIKLLNALSKALDLDIQKNGNSITITRN